MRAPLEDIDVCMISFGALGFVLVAFNIGVTIRARRLLRELRDPDATYADLAFRGFDHPDPWIRKYYRAGLVGVLVGFVVVALAMAVGVGAIVYQTFGKR